MHQLLAYFKAHHIPTPSITPVQIFFYIRMKILNIYYKKKKNSVNSKIQVLLKFYNVNLFIDVFNKILKYFLKDQFYFKQRQVIFIVVMAMADVHDPLHTYMLCTFYSHSFNRIDTIGNSKFSVVNSLQRK